MLPSHDQIVRECDEHFAAMDASFAECAKPLDPDTEAMVTRPAATVAGSVNLLDATMSMLNRPAPVAALTLALIVSRYAPVTDEDARRAVEGTNLDMVA